MSQTYGQLDLAVYQDLSLAVSEDDHGNTPFTPDIVAMFKMYNGGNRRGGDLTRNIMVYVLFEYADLASKEYMRWAMGVGYKIPIWKFYIEPSVDYGVIKRWGTTMSSNFNTSVSYPITKRLNISILGSLTKRTDLNSYWGGTNWRTNGYVGATYKLVKE